MLVGSTNEMHIGREKIVGENRMILFLKVLDSKDFYVGINSKQISHDIIIFK